MSTKYIVAKNGAALPSDTINTIWSVMCTKSPTKVNFEAMGKLAKGLAMGRSIPDNINNTKVKVEKDVAIKAFLANLDNDVFECKAEVSGIETVLYSFTRVELEAYIASMLPLESAYNALYTSWYAIRPEVENDKDKVYFANFRNVMPKDDSKGDGKGKSEKNTLERGI